MRSLQQQLCISLYVCIASLTIFSMCIKYHLTVLFSSDALLWHFLHCRWVFCKQFPFTYHLFRVKHWCFRVKIFQNESITFRYFYVLHTYSSHPYCLILEAFASTRISRFSNFFLHNNHNLTILFTL